MCTSRYTTGVFCRTRHKFVLLGFASLRQIYDTFYKNPLCVTRYTNYYFRCNNLLSGQWKNVVVFKEMRSESFTSAFPTKIPFTYALYTIKTIQHLESLLSMWIVVLNALTTCWAIQSPVNQPEPEHRIEIPRSNKSQ